MKNLFIPLVAILVLSACKKDVAIKHFDEVQLLRKSDGCAPLIQFVQTQNDSKNVFGNTFRAINLETANISDSTIFMVSSRDPRNDEMIICNTMTPGYPQIFIEEVKFD